MVAQLCKYNKNQWPEHLKWVNCKVCKLYFNKAVKIIYAYSVNICNVRKCGLLDSQPWNSNLICIVE